MNCIEVNNLSYYCKIYYYFHEADSFNPLGKRNKTKQINKFGVEIKIRYFIEYSIEHLFTMIFGGKDLFTKIDTTYLLSKVCRQYFTQCHPTQSNDYS